MNRHRNEGFRSKNFASHIVAVRRVQGRRLERLGRLGARRRAKAAEVPFIQASPRPLVRAVYHGCCLRIHEERTKMGSQGSLSCSAMSLETNHRPFLRQAVLLAEQQHGVCLFVDVRCYGARRVDAIAAEV